MKNQDIYDTIIIGGSYAGLSAGLSLGRSLRKVLIVDSGKPCNKPTPFSHNFLTQDGKSPQEISNIARADVLKYDTVHLINDTVTKTEKRDQLFFVTLETGEVHISKYVLFATGLKDLLPPIAGLSECWGISVIHCPYCHGFEEKNKKTGILLNGEKAFDFGKLIYNWTKSLTIYTNGKSILTNEQTEVLKAKNINIIEKEIHSLLHKEGRLNTVVFKDSSKETAEVMYSKPNFEQQTLLPESLGCEYSDNLIVVDESQKTKVDGVYACGDNCSTFRAVILSVASGAQAGGYINQELVKDEF